MNQEAITNNINNLDYFKDKRTNLCFAGLDLLSNAQSITNVPCTPEVENLIK